MKIKTISIIQVCAFTEKAAGLFNKLNSSLPEIQWTLLENKDELSKWTKAAFEKSLPLLFISAAGIAVRTIAPFIQDKFYDSPVLVMDEEGKFIIPVLSGHLGNANSIAEKISKAINAEAVITTATDVNKKFSIDNFAKSNALKIINRDKIKSVSSKILSGSKINIFIEPNIKVNDKNIPAEINLVNEEKNAGVVITQKAYENYENIDKLILVPKKYCIGMGCKKGISFEELKKFAENIFKEKLNCSLLNEVVSLASIDLKEKETGLMELSHYLHVPFITFSADELMKAPGSFSESEFVQQTTGVSNVCERSAVLSAGRNGSLLIKKIAGNGITLSVAEKIPEIKF